MKKVLNDLTAVLFGIAIGIFLLGVIHAVISTRDEHFQVGQRYHLVCSNGVKEDLVFHSRRAMWDFVDNIVDESNVICDVSRVR